MTKTLLALSLLLCSLYSMAQPRVLHYSTETWVGVLPDVTPAPGVIVLDEQNKSIRIQSRYRDETYKIIRTIQNEDDLAVYGCETRFPGGKLVRYVVKYDAAQMVVVLYPDNPYLKASTTFQLTAE